MFLNVKNRTRKNNSLHTECLYSVTKSRTIVSRFRTFLGLIAGGVRTTTAMHCGFTIFKMAAKVETFRRLYALFFNRYSSFLR